MKLRPDRDHRFFAGKTCVVTGASSGLGRAIAHHLARAGASVCAVARREDRLKELVGELGGDGSHTYCVTDVADHQAVEEMAAFVDETYRRCDLLVNNAGFGREAPLDSPDGVEVVRGVMETNFFGTVTCTAELLPLLEGSAPSNVVNIASVAGKIAVGTPAYTASKFALIGWSEAIGYQLARQGVTVSVVNPGFIPTEGFPQSDLVANPITRLLVGKPDDVAEAVLLVAERNKRERVVPRWYYPAALAREAFPPVTRFVVSRFIAPAAERRRAGR